MVFETEHKSSKWELRLERFGRNLKMTIESVILKTIWVKERLGEKNLSQMTENPFSPDRVFGRNAFLNWGLRDLEKILISWLGRLEKKLKMRIKVRETWK
jgi:hypothetical protein